MGQREQYLEMRVSRLEHIVKCLKVQIDNCCGLTPCVPPTITVQPSSGSVNQGANITLSVVAAGTTPLTYQWRKGSTNIVGATNGSLTITSAQTSDAGAYTVVITNECGTITSNPANLNVVVQVTIYAGWVAGDDPDFADKLVQFKANPTAMQRTSTIVSGASSIVGDFRQNTVPAILLIAEPIGQPLKNKWFGTVLNNGNISQDINNPNGETFVTHINSNDAEINPAYRYYISDFQTQQTDTTISFNVS